MKTNVVQTKCILPKTRLEFLNTFPLCFLDVFSNNIGETIISDICFLISRTLSLILKHCMSAFTVFKIHHGMHIATI